MGLEKEVEKEESNWLRQVEKAIGDFNVRCHKNDIFVWDVDKSKRSIIPYHIGAIITQPIESDNGHNDESKVLVRMAEQTAQKYGLKAAYQKPSIDEHRRRIMYIRFEGNYNNNSDSNNQ